jgi:hypothetical protein
MIECLPIAISFEILQNAEPKDSKGTWFDVEFLPKENGRVTGKWPILKIMK